MNRDDCRVVYAAANELSATARDIRSAHTLNGDWGDERAAKAWHDKCLQLAMRLRQIAKAERAKLPKKGERLAIGAKP